MRKTCIILFFCFLVVTGCSQSDIYEGNQSGVIRNDTIAQNVEANKWILKTMKLYYYWADSIPENMIDSVKLTPDIFFYKLLDKEDRFSWISESEARNNEALYGNILNKGFEYILFFSDTTMHNLTAEIICTYPNSDAEKKGIKRGWFFDTIDGCKMNVDNYMQLLSCPNSEYKFWHFNDDNTIDTILIDVNQERQAINPILKSTVISHEGHKVGYLCYRQFKADDGDGSQIYKKELLEHFMDFKNKGIDNLVLDLRYNPGGDLKLCATLGSLIVPKSDSAQVALKIQYNKKLTEAYSSIGLENDIFYENNLDSYIGDKLYNIIIITGPATASASEDVINMLMPYKKPILIGQTTYGKNYGSQSVISSNKEIKWVMQPIIMKVFNGVGESNFDNGFEPDYEVDENHYIMREFGDIKEPLFATALDVIGNNKKAKRFSRVWRGKSSKLMFFNSLEKHTDNNRFRIEDTVVVE